MLRFHYDNENENVLPGFLFVIVVVDDEMEATSRSS